MGLVLGLRCAKGFVLGARVLWSQSNEGFAMYQPDASTGSRERPCELHETGWRRVDALRKAEMAQTAAKREAMVAQQLIDQFIAQARERGIRPEPLRMKLSGGGTARTDKKGWYIKVDQTVAIGEDGGYYILSMPGGLRERVSGVRLRPSQPCLEVSRGGRDGETGGLSDFLTKRLRQALGGCWSPPTTP